MSDVITITDLEETKKHNTFHVDVITGRTGEYATNAVTGQVQKTLPATIDGLDWSYVGKFADGVTFTKKTDFAIDSNGTQWIYAGSDPFPKAVAGGAVPGEPDYQVVHVRSHALLTDLNPADGSAHNADDINYARSGNNRLLQSKVNEIVSLQDYGALDNFNGTTGTNCWDALTKLFDDYPDYNVTVKLPKTNTGVYYFVGNSFVSDVSGLVIEADDGVSIVFDGTYFPLISRGIKANREIKVHIVQQNYNFYLGKTSFNRPSAEQCKLTNSSGDVATFTALAPNQSLYYKKLEFASNTVSPLTPANITSTTLEFTTDSTSFDGAFYKAKIARELQCYASAPSYDGALGVAVLTVDGYGVIYQDYAGGDILFRHISGAGGFVTGSKPTVIASDSYRAVRALLGVRVHNNRSFSLLLNGIDVCRIDDVGSDIISMGFIAGLSTSANDIAFASTTYSDDKKSSGMRLLKICCLGDSTSDPGVTISAFDFMKQYLAGVSGIQVKELKNLAVSGETSGQQLSRLQAEDISGYDYLLSDVGINDIQGNLGANGLNNNTVSIINIAKAAGVTPIIGIPTMWYSQSEAQAYGQDGQNTANANGGSQYRGSLVETAASNGALVNINTLQDLGVADPSLLTNGLTDPVLMDNIHPTNFGRQLRGLAWAKAVLGHALPKNTWEPLPINLPSSYLLNGAGATNVPYLLVNKDSVSIAGPISVTTIANGTVIFNLPEGLRPIINHTVSTVTADGTGTPSDTCIVQLDATGNATLYGAAANTSFAYININFPR